jgi:hypothetical protein
MMKKVLFMILCVLPLWANAQVNDFRIADLQKNKWREHQQELNRHKEKQQEALQLTAKNPFENIEAHPFRIQTPKRLFRSGPTLFRRRAHNKQSDNRPAGQNPAAKPPGRVALLLIHMVLIYRALRFIPQCHLFIISGGIFLYIDIFYIEYSYKEYI